jgi:hypothetical protein
VRIVAPAYANRLRPIRLRLTSHNPEAPIIQRKPSLATKVLFFPLKISLRQRRVSPDDDTGVPEMKGKQNGNLAIE